MVVLVLIMVSVIQNYRQLLVQYKSRILPRHHPATIMVERIGQRIFLVAGYVKICLTGRKEGEGYNVLQPWQWI